MAREAKKYKQHKQGETIFDALPLEIIHDILSRLSVKCVTRFRCVSKSWQHLFEDQIFISTYALNQAARKKPNSKLILSCNGNKLYLLDYDSPHRKFIDLYHPILKPSIHSWGSCNGLIYTIPRNEEEGVSLWNPVTGKCRIVRGFAQSSAGYGLGYNDYAEDYELVRVSSDYKYIGKHHSVVDVYSLKKNSCKRISNIQCRIRDGSPGVFFKGSIYWMASVQLWACSYDYLVAYDMRRCKFKCIERLNYLDGIGDTNEMNIAALGGKLCVYYNHEKFAEARIVNFTGDSPSVLYKIEQYPDISHIKPLCFTKNGCILLLKDGMKLIVYNPRNELYSSFSFWVEGSIPVVNEATTYVENIISLGP